ncbi:type I DNA topoisomerase [Desulfobacca acetoxidans]|uniref:DNA topoisomerase 1 n=1 Tax=Desulfobacca acetoxidans (strain ATCC 700848 / DSM 11109 / ASRB2) TaxID=880072 RepID=F2NDW2_DESAR|nr:type I DNA topoisomerase [Desulfobacca acetoxidans]AEB10459.1 DNA topoisomerase I [Desulfobacca acetoxidans DSM 11109]
MTKSLLIVESPAKARTLQKYLGKDFEVRASVGHIKDLPKKELGVDVEKNFIPKYVTIDGKTKTIQDLKRAAHDVEDIYLGPDPDREGEAIAWHIAEVLKSGKHRFHRVLFYELTPRAIQEALAKPMELNRPRYEAQQARRILDRLVGYQISPLLWEKVKRGLSAGRVQSVALRLICDREREILAFVSQEYWSLTAHLKAEQPPPFQAKLIRYKGKKLELAKAEQTQAVVAALEGAQYTVTAVEQKERQKKPLPPFITSTMQQEASRKLRFAAKKTMQVAQRLYEGKDLGAAGPVGLITYMRTDSTRVAGEAVAAVRDFIRQEFGPDYLPAKPNAYKSRKTAQEAHEAIRPTDVSRTPAAVAPFLEKDELRLYELIWKRFVASQMEPARLLVTTADISANHYTFRATGTVVKFPGFTVLYEETPDAAGEEEDIKLPPLKVGELLELLQLEPKQHFTQPPPRYTEATLIKELEKQGIGRPSTYATILSVILGRLYVAKIKAGFKPTELGLMINDLLVASFPKIMNVGFTANLEDRLDAVAEGEVIWQEVLRDFYGSFSQELQEAKQVMPRVKSLATGLTCPQCGAELLIKWGKTGEFLGCSGYPECRYTRNFSRDEQGRIVPEEKNNVPAPDLPEITEVCPKCGQTLVAKQGRFGPFLACPGYPKCRYTRSLQEEEGEVEAVPCPQPDCTGVLRARKSKRGVFYGCSNYPECTYALNYPPVAKACPQCGFPVMVRKELKKQGKILACPQKSCGYTEPDLDEPGTD